MAGRQGGNLPPALQRENSNKMPVVIILLQATISSILSLGYFFLGSVQNAWFMFALIQTNMTLIMYLIMFASVIKLRYSRPNVNRPYQIPARRSASGQSLGSGCSCASSASWCHSNQPMKLPECRLRCTSQSC